MIVLENIVLIELMMSFITLRKIMLSQKQKNYHIRNQTLFENFSLE